MVVSTSLMVRESAAVGCFNDLPTETEITGTTTSRELADASLVRMIQAGSAEAEHVLVIRFRGTIYSVLINMTGDPDRAEDLTHETLIILLEKLRSEPINKPHKLTSYVMSTARFHYFSWLRKKDNQLELHDEMSAVAAPEINPESLCEEMESVASLEAWISGMSTPRDREILSRRYLTDQSKAEICEAMDLSVNHYDRVISRARLRLKKQVCA